MWEKIGSAKRMSSADYGASLKGREGSETSIQPAITISREAGAGGHTVASNLAELLQESIPSHDAWTVFDRNIVEEVLDEHHHHRHVAHYLREGHKGVLIDAVEEMLGLHPSSWTLVEQTKATILRLAQLGNVILVGRGASVIAAELPSAFHVRLVGSPEKRLEWLERVHGLDRKAALQFLKREDEGRRRYLKDNFDRNIDDPLLYHLVINTDLIGHAEAARLIGHEVIRRFKLSSPRKATGSGNAL